MNVVQSLGYQATRAADTALGAAATAAENIGEAVRRDPRRELDRLRGDLDTSVRRFERRGAQARKRTTRVLERRRERAARAIRRGRQDAEKRVDATRGDVKAATDKFATRVQETAGRSS